MMNEEEAKRQASIAAQAAMAGLPEWQQEAAMAVPSSLVRDIVSDNRGQSTKAQPQAAVKASSGGTIPLKQPSKFESDLFDRMVAHYAGGPNSAR